jgi:hypothetical protein
MAAVLMLVLAPAARAAPMEGSSSFATPGAHVWTVPKHARSATFDLYGAAGGSHSVVEGGRGAHVRATVAVQAGDALTIVVGGSGGDVAGRMPGAGGVNGGAPGGAGAEDFVLVNPPVVLPGGPAGAGGGGASDVRTQSAGAAGLASRLVVAAGGGGAGGVRGGAGGAVGQDGSDGPVTSNFATFPDQPGGGGGTATAGGAGAFGASDGSAGSGGGGADAPLVQILPGAPRPGAITNGQGGGGGGGGLFGGGGGTAGSTSTTGLLVIASTASGGGGGSSLAPAGSPCPVVVETGARAGEGLVVVRWTKAKKPKHACP